MSVDIYPDTLELASWPITADVDLTSATAVVYIGGTWQAAAWAGAAVQTGAKWARTAQLLLAGANPNSGVKVTRSDQLPLVKTSVGGEIIVHRSTIRFNFYD